MSERRAHREVFRTDAQILAHDRDMQLLAQVEQRALVTEAANRMDVRRLERDDLILAGFGLGTIATLLPRGVRLLEAARGAHPAPQ